MAAASKRISFVGTRADSFSIEAMTSVARSNVAVLSLRYNRKIQFGGLFRHAADYADHILKGERDLPVEAPTEFEFIINLKAANELGGRGAVYDSFRYAFKATSTRSGRSGEWRTRAPVRAATALLTAGPTRGVAICPAPVG
jgi:hypothetical protein